MPPSAMVLLSLVEAEMTNDGVPFEEAAVRVHERILGDSESNLRAWWAAVGMAAIRRVAWRLTQQRRDGPHGPHTPAMRPSWRAILQKNPELVWEIELPVGATGVVKRLGDFTRRDVGELERWYRGQADVMVMRAEYWSRIQRSLEPKDTMETAARAGRLKEEQIQFVGNRCEDLATYQLLSEDNDPE